MRLISWNVNGLRSCAGKGLGEFLASADADIICFQETKLQPEQNTFEPEGYFRWFYSAEKKGYSGTAVFSKTEPQNVTCGIGVPELDNEGRVITAEFETFYLVTCYTPNAQRELTRLAYRMVWEDAFRSYVTGLAEKKAVVICGDLNVAHKEIDLKNAKSNRGNAGFTDEEREKFSVLLDSGFVDSFRYLHPEEEKYSWWSYMFKAREKNVGWRIDYFLVSENGKDRILAADILTDVMGSDHAPVYLEFDA
ncbi:MAG: exodeoxyribonuclease III [Clostridia bacterium]|nr:exodeoxyribonuclease III [Clostridia bacterium]